MRTAKVLKLLSIFVLLVAFSGCTVIFQKGRRSDLDKINELSGQVDMLSKAKADLEDQLAKEIAAKEVSVSMEDRGLVVTFVSEVLFDSGKANLKSQSFEALNKVAGVLDSAAAGMKIGVEGHTDNQPIKFSGWESNWELSAARAKSVLKYLLSKGVAPDRLSFTGYGEYRPVDSNDTKEGRQKNRRVEIIIVPPLSKTENALALESTTLVEPTENLK